MATVVATGTWVVALTSCGAPGIRAGGAPTCRNLSKLVLLAQSVETAASVPCIKLFPAGWTFSSMKVDSNRASFVLDSDRAGEEAVTVLLAEGCDVSGATAIGSDQEGASRYERVRRLQGGYVGSRHYLLDRGGCVTYDFDFDEVGQALANEATLALDLVPRQEVAERLEKERGERLDPPRAPT